MTTKLEELKALMAEEKKWRTEYINARNANDDREDVASFRLSFRMANKLKLMLSEELLLPLISVAEAAQAVHNRWESTDWKTEPTAGFMNVLRDSLEPLTKETK